MAHDTDISVLDSSTEFRKIKLSQPFMISGRKIDWFTLAIVEVRVRNAAGKEAVGRGATILSVPWSWPGESPSVKAKDAVLREITRRFADLATSARRVDPVAWWLSAEEQLDDVVAAAAKRRRVREPVPDLAAMLALGAVDSALHDAWARAAGRPAFEMYGPDYLSADLSAVYGPEFAGLWPGDFLRTPAQHVLPVQHLVGANDRIGYDGASLGYPDPKEERPLLDWLKQEGVRHIKVKLHGNDPREDAERVIRIHNACLSVLDSVELAVDLNEGYASPEQLIMFLEEVRVTGRYTIGAITYVEQPVPRDSVPDPAILQRANDWMMIPVLMDEGLTDIRTVPDLRSQGWDGIVIKAGKGQTPAILAHAAARHLGMPVMVQDLTAVDLAFLHSVRLASVFDTHSTCVEYNSRQYAPRGNDALAAKHYNLTRVAQGRILVPSMDSPGLY